MVFSLVVEVECFSNYFAFGHVALGAFVLHPINRILGEANGECWVFAHREFQRLNLVNPSMISAS